MVSIIKKLRDSLCVRCHMAYRTVRLESKICLICCMPER